MSEHPLYYSSVCVLLAV